MGPDGFAINNPALEGANDELNRAVWVMGDIIDRLNTDLARMSGAAQNSAIAPWADLQKKWNGDYDTMTVRLENGHHASVDAHDWYKTGDMQSVRIMIH